MFGWATPVATRTVLVTLNTTTTKTSQNIGRLTGNRWVNTTSLPCWNTSSRLRETRRFLMSLTPRAQLRCSTDSPNTKTTIRTVLTCSLPWAQSPRSRTLNQMRCILLLTSTMRLSSNATFLVFMQFSRKILSLQRH